MAGPNKPMPKNSNSKFTTRNNKQDIFSKFSKSSKLKSELDKRTKDTSEPMDDDTNS